MQQEYFLPDQLRLTEKKMVSHRNFVEEESELQHDICLLTSSSDVGVMRNLGRNGSKYGPQVLLNQILSLQYHQKKSIVTQEVAEEKLELRDFNLAQNIEAEKILRYLQLIKRRRTIHLGGGHDHVYPLLKAIEAQGFKKIIVLNIDAHCDTRQSKHNHSGTPLRQWLNEARVETHLFQYGIHRFANSLSTLNDLPSMKTFPFEQIKKLSHNFSQLPLQLLNQILVLFDKDTFFLLSIDADALSSSVMTGVSAVNPEGLPLAHLRHLTSWFLKEVPVEKMTGIYEYNPVYDPNSSGSKAIASLVYDFLD